MIKRAAVPITMVLLACAGAYAAGRVVDGAPVALDTAQTWCVAPLAPLPNWDQPAHPECDMRWRVFAEHGDRILYSARYAWPSYGRSRQPLRVLSEVLYEGARGSSVVRPLYAVQEDEAHLRMAPLRLVTVGGAAVIESVVCMSETGECGRELAVWTDGRVEAIKNQTVAEIRAQLPKGYDLRLNPDIDLTSLSGTGKAWSKNDSDCCPSATIEFKLRLDARELHADDVTLQPHAAVADPHARTGLTDRPS